MHEAEQTERQAIGSANERVRRHLNHRLDEDAADIARLYKGSRDRLMMHLRGIYDSYLADDPSYVRARQTGTLSRFNQAIQSELDLLTDEIGQRAVGKMSELLNTQYTVLDRNLGKRFGGLFTRLPMSSRTVLGELTSAIIGGATFEDRTLHMNDLLKRDIYNDLRRGLINGDDFGAIRGRLMKSFGVDKLAEPHGPAYGSVKLYKNEARRQWNLLMRQHAAQTDAVEVWWAMIDDPAVTPGCAARHGMEIEDELDGETPPRHYNCRCTIAVVPHDYDLEGERAMAAAVLDTQGYTPRSAMLEEAWNPEQHPRDEQGRFAGGPGATPEDVEEWAAQAGARFDGIQEHPGGDPLVLITDKQTHSTATIPLSKVSPETVKAKMDELRKRFQQRESSRHPGWGWGRTVIQPVSLISEVLHVDGAAYRAVPWRALPREATGVAVGARWSSSPLVGVASDSPDAALLRRVGGRVDVQTWQGWRPLTSFTTVIETRTGIVDDSAVIQPPWDEQVQRFPRAIVERWPALAPVVFPMTSPSLVAIVDRPTAEQLTLGTVDPALIVWQDAHDLQAALGILFWRQGHPARPHFVYATTPTAVKMIVDITTGEMVYINDTYAGNLQAPYTRVAAVVLSEHGRIWAILPRGMTKWVLPGGHIDNGETERDAVVREMLEETGQHVGVIRSLGTLYRPWSRTIIILCRHITEHRDWSPTDETDAVLEIPFTELAADERLFLERHGIRPRWQEAVRKDDTPEGGA